MEDQAEKFRQQKKHNGLLLVAASRGYQADVEALVEMGAALDAKDKQGRQPLHFAAANGRIGVVKFLWSRGAEVDAESPEGCTPLHLAALGGHAEVARFLLQKGAWAEAYDAADDTPLHLAAKQGHVEVLELLVQHGVKPGAKNKQGLTALGCAVVGGHVAAAKLLQGWGASLADRPHSYTLLHLAAGVGALASVAFLLEGGTDPNERSNPEGATPLHSAALGGCVRCAKALLDAGADAGLADAQGRLPADLVAAEHIKLRELLKATPSSKGIASRAGSREAAAEAKPKSAQQQFIELSQAERVSKVERWSLLDAADLAAALKQYPPQAAAVVTARLAELAAARKVLNIHKALAALHADEDFQADARQAHVREAIDAIRADTSKYERYTADPQILEVLQKMRRLHGVAQANGQRTVDIESMLAEPGWEHKDAERQQAIEAACAAHLAAAAAAAATTPDAGSPEEAAKAAYEGSLKEAREAASSKGKGAAAATKKPAGTSTGGATSKLEAAGGNAAASILRQRLGGSSSVKAETAGSSGNGTSKRTAAAAAAESEAAAQVLEEQERRPDEDEDLPEWMRGGFSWKKVGAEMWRQTKMSLLILLAFLIVSSLVRGRAPWVP